MRKVAGVFAAIALGALLPLWTANAQLPAAGAPLGSKSETPGAFPDVIPGDNILIACDAVEKRAADSDVRVVLTISAMPGESTTGYAKVLATDELLLKDAVRVRIPLIPNLEQHTVGLDVYVVGSANAEHCDAGHMKIS
ncbi:MAG TPA: hypothetical protein VG274_04910 [Rhizomicrobium sp.]|nr:hypothetical protein [Rhizomicrobium sp.]